MRYFVWIWTFTIFGISQNETHLNISKGIPQDETHLNISKGGSAPKGCGDPCFSNSIHKGIYGRLIWKEMKKLSFQSWKGFWGQKFKPWVEKRLGQSSAKGKVGQPQIWPGLKMFNKLRLKTFNNLFSYKGQNKYCLIKNMLGTWKSATTETRIMTPVSITSSRDPPDVAHIPLKAFVEKHGHWYKGRIMNSFV